MRKLLAGIFIFLLPCMAGAAEKPPELATTMTAAQPVGTASYSTMMLHVYDAAFWSDSGGWAQPPYALSITYHMHIDADDLVDRTEEEMHNVSRLPQETLSHYADMLRSLYPDVKPGDRITALQQDSATTVFFYNGKRIGEIKNPTFAKTFFSIWFSPQTSEPEMRQHLLHRDS